MAVSIFSLNRGVNGAMATAPTRTLSMKLTLRLIHHIAPIKTVRLNLAPFNKFCSTFMLIASGSESSSESPSLEPSQRKFDLPVALSQHEGS